MGVASYPYLYRTETKLCHIVGVVLCVLSDERAQGDGVLKKVLYGGSAARSNLPFYILFLTENVPLLSTVEPRCNKGPRDWHNLFAITQLC